MAFRDLVGHRATLGLIARALDAGTLPPSLVFGGPEGVGKRQVALALAQTLNCLQLVRPAPWPDGSAAPLAVDACGECTACRRIARGQHPDVRVVEPGETGVIKIDDVREVIREGGYKPFEAKRRISIFDAAEAIGAEGQNALLKTLEEPPASSVLVLVTSQPGALLPTVLSRCPTVRFSPLSPSDVASWLMSTRGMPEAKARDIAAVVRGSLSAAAAAAEDGVGGSYRAGAHRALELVADARDVRERLAATASIVGKGKGTGASERESLAEHLHAMAALLRDLGVLATRADRSAVTNVDLRTALEALSPSFDHDRTIRAFEALDCALAALERNGSPKTVADWLVLQL
jgi:DNA polymerase III subunit delta'